VDHKVTVGSSDVAAILGLSPWTSPSKAWARLTGLVPRYDGEQSGATARGHIIEPALLAEWRRQRQPVGWTPGPAITEPPTIRDGWKHAREDMLAVMEDGRRVIVEAKTTRAFDEQWGESGSDIVPLGYLAQVIWQMHVLDVDGCELVAFATLADEMRTYRIARDLAREAKLVGAVEAWMQRYVWADPPEQPADMTMEVVSALHRDGGKPGVWLRPDERTLALAAELYDINAELRALTAAKESLQTRIARRIGDAYGIEGVASWARQKAARAIDIDRLEAEYPEVFAAVAKPQSTIRVFRLKYKDAEK